MDHTGIRYIITPSRLPEVFTAGIAVVILVIAGVISNATAKPMHQMILFDLIDKISASPPTSHELVERLFGSKLMLVNENVFRYYEARDVRVGSVVFRLLDYREPPPSGAIRGPFLALTLGDNVCIAKDKVLSRFDGLEVRGAPSDGSDDEELYYSQTMPWGQLSFGFQKRSPDCVASVRFAFNQS